MTDPQIEELVGSFGADLRRLRIEAGEPAFRSLAHATGYGRTTLNDALKGDRLPTLDVTLGLVKALGGDEAAWRARWISARAALDAQPSSTPKTAPDADRSTARDGHTPGQQGAVGNADLPGAPTGTTSEGPSSNLGETPRRLSKRRKAILAAVAGVLLIGAALLVVNLFGHDEPGGPSRGHCERVRQYRITTSGNILASNGEVVGTVVTGDLFKAQRTNGLPYFAHRYYGTVVRTGTWGYVDQSKLRFSANTCL